MRCDDFNVKGSSKYILYLEIGNLGGLMEVLLPLHVMERKQRNEVYIAPLVPYVGEGGAHRWWM